MKINHSITFPIPDTSCKNVEEHNGILNLSKFTGKPKYKFLGYKFPRNVNKKCVY